MNHLFVCREYPPAAYPPGGIGTYVQHITRVLASAGETVHVIAHRWDGAPARRTELLGRRLIVHRVALDDAGVDPRIGRGLLASSCPAQAFSWHAAILAEELIAAEHIDVVEAQEWEAPLYYLQLRRALQLGPVRRPPCIVHVHSPTERIFAANQWDTTVADYAPTVAMEEYSIRSADALLCASRFVADEITLRYGVQGSQITVIPYPLGDTPRLERGPEVWNGGTVCQVGRIERRKGVFDWIEAIGAVAGDYPRARFEFVGGETPLHVTGGASAGHAAFAGLPGAIRPRVRRLGIRERAGLLEALSRARIATVPSRWENFPYSAIEAMATGLPVLASPCGGMRELVEDGVSGWIASDGTPSGLAAALRRALDTPGGRLSEMGREAEARVRFICDNDTVRDRHLVMKAALAARKSRCASTTSRPDSVVCIQFDRSSAADKSLQAAADLLRTGPPLEALLFVDRRATVDPSFPAMCAALFSADHRLGIIAGWVRDLAPGGHVHVPPRPTAPHLWDDGQVAPCLAVRRTALDPLITSHPTTAGNAMQDALDQIVQRGWTTVAYPAVTASLILSEGEGATRRGTVRYSAMAQSIQRLHIPLLQWLLTCSAEDRRSFLRQGASRPWLAIRWLATRAVRSRRAPLTNG